MQRYIDDGTIRGCNTLVARRGHVVHAESLGMRDSEAGVAMTNDTIFRIYSMTKPIVATALMLLWEDGAFMLNDPVANYLPAFGATQVMAADGALEAQRSPMTVRQLLTHTSGLTYDFLEDSPVCAMYRDARLMNDPTRTLAEVIDALSEIPLAFQPGSRWHYSVGIDVAARLIEVLSGQSLQRFLDDRILTPLNMTTTGFEVDPAIHERVAVMYGLPDLVGVDYSASDLVTAAVAGVNDRHDVSATYPLNGGDAYARGGVGLFSTIGDYHGFANMLRTGRTESGDRIVGRKTLEMMHTNHLTDELRQNQLEIMGQPTPGYGFGLGSRVLMNPTALGAPGSPGEFGWAGAAKTYFWVDPVEDLVGIFMAQYMTGPVNVDHTFRSLAYQAIDD